MGYYPRYARYGRFATARPVTKVMHARFAGRCSRCGQDFPMGTEIVWSSASHAATHAHACAQFVPPVVVMDLKPIADFLGAAVTRGLQRPKLRILDVDGKSELRLTLRTQGNNPGTVDVKRFHDYLGSVKPDGSVQGSLRSNTPLQQHLEQIALDPAAAAKKYAAVMCQCSFCGKALTDEGSVDVGYGPVCAKHWGLPHKMLGTTVLQQAPPAVSSVFASDIDLDPGDFPVALHFDGSVWRFRDYIKDADGDITGANYYVDGTTKEMVVLND